MNEAPRIALVVAMARNRTIGRSGAMPWRMRSDLQWFKSVTLGKPIIMGRKTFQSIGKPLPGRTNIVITRQETFAADGVLVAGSLDEALDLARLAAQEQGTEEICVVGGGEIYRAALALADRLYLTVIEAELDGDTWFPEFNAQGWAVSIEGHIEASETDDYPARIEIWDRA